MNAQPPPVLTRKMQPVIEAIGFDGAIQLAASLGGTRALLRAQPLANDAIARAIGLEQACRLVGTIGAGPLEVPRCVAWLIARRNEEIVARWDGGETQAELALRFSITERQIRSVLARSTTGSCRQAPKEDPRQASLLPSEETTA